MNGRLIHHPGEHHLDPVYAVLDEFAFTGLVSGEEVRPKTSDGTPIVLRLSDIGFVRMVEILRAVMLSRRQDAVERELFAKADAATGTDPES
jgi:hypothetical protein